MVTAKFEGPFRDTKELRSLLYEFSEHFANLEVDESAVIGRANRDVLVVRGVLKSRIPELAKKVGKLRV